MQLHDSLYTRLKPVVPSFSKQISIYACGITPYSSAHVGHARTYVVFDLLKNVLEAQGYDVRLVRNITDIDDKIIAAAEKAGMQWDQLSAHFADENTALMLSTGLGVPEQPKASEFLPAIFTLVQQLVEKGYAYVAANGDVLYRVKAFQGQELLMPHKEGSLRSEQGVSRVDSSAKEDLRDFALWKRFEPSQVGFESPWGWGRPGWHIECSAMIHDMFNDHVCIHAGGVDLKFPHHQAELMQTQALTGTAMADIWMHNGSVTSAGKKMSKSEGNFVTWQVALDQSERLAPGVGGDLLRIALMQTHWQKPLDWTPELLERTAAMLKKLTNGLDVSGTSEAESLAPAIEQLNSNLNTPAVFVWLHEQHKAGNYGVVRAALELLKVDVAKWTKLIDVVPVQAALTLDEIERLQVARIEARAQKNWALADELRDRIVKAGVAVKDTAV